MKSIKELIKEIEKEQKEYGENIQCPAKKEDIYTLQKEVEDEFDFTLDKVYTKILEVVNGIDSDGTILYATERCLLEGYSDRYIDGLIDANKIWHEDLHKKTFLVYAESDMYLFFQTIEKNSKFCIVPRDSFDCTVYQTTNSIDFFTKILESCLGRYVE